MYKPNYHITDELLNKIAQIEAFRQQIATSYILPEREVEMRYRATVEATHSSTSIEGNPLNIKQVEKVLASRERLTRHQYAEIEVRNYKKALDFVDKRKDDEQPIVLDDILKIHKLIMSDLLPSEKVGVLRKNPIYIVNQDEQVVYTGPSANSLPKTIDELLDWLKTANNIHPVIVAAVLHFHFVSIHPFSDGNGRTTRVLTALYLGLHDYDFRSSLVLDSYYSADKREYYDALNLADAYAGREKADLSPWINYFADGFLSSARVLSTEVAILSNIAKKQPIKQKVSREEATVLNYVQQFGSITIAEAEDILIGVSRRTVQRKLGGLVDEGYLELEGGTNRARYIAKKREEAK